MLAQRLDPQQQVQALVVNVRERVSRVDRQRSEHRVDLAVKIVIKKRVLSRSQFVRWADPDAMLTELGVDLLKPGLVEPGHEVMGATGDLQQLGQWPHAVGG